MQVAFLIFGVSAFLGGMLVVAQGPIYSQLAEGWAGIIFSPSSLPLQPQRL
jgi:hypothetical protein